MTEKDDDSGFTVSARLPKRFVYTFGAGVATLFLGVGGAVYKGSQEQSLAAYYESTKRTEMLAAEAVKIATSSSGSASDANQRISALAVALETLRTELLRGQSDRYTKSEADRINASNEREHQLLKQADTGHDKDISRVADDVDKLKRRFGE